MVKQRDKELEKGVQEQILSAAQAFSLTICITSTKTLAKWPLIVASALPGGKVFVNGGGGIEGRVFGLEVDRNQRCTSRRQRPGLSTRQLLSPLVPSHRPFLQHSFHLPPALSIPLSFVPSFSQSRLSPSLPLKEIRTLTLLTSPYCVSTLRH